MRNARLKAFGHMPGVPFGDVDKVAVDPAILQQERWCLHADYPDEEIAAMDPGYLAYYTKFDIDECQAIIQSHERMIKSTGTGSWPVGCNPEYPNHHSVKVFIDYSTFKPIHTRTVRESELDQILQAGVWRMTRDQVYDLYQGKPMVEVAMALCNETYRRVGCAHIMKDDGPNGDHNIHISSKYIAGSTIGYAYFNDGTCGDHVNNFIDNSWDGGLMGLSRLLAHECGHNHDLQHQFSNQNYHRGVMSYSPPSSGLFYGYSTGEAPHSLPKDPSLAILIRQYGNQEVPLPNPPVPPTPGQPFDGTIFGDEFEEGKFAIRGDIVAARDIKAGESFIVVPGTETGKYRIRTKPNT